MPPVCVRIIVIALVIIELAWLKNKKIDDLARLVTCRWFTPVMVSSYANSLVVDENTRE